MTMGTLMTATMMKKTMLMSQGNKSSFFRDSKKKSLNLHSTGTDFFRFQKFIYLAPKGHLR